MDYPAHISSARQIKHNMYFLIIIWAEIILAMSLTNGISFIAIYPDSTLEPLTSCKKIVPLHQMMVAFYLEKFAAVRVDVNRKCPHPRPQRHVGNSKLPPYHIIASVQMLIQHIQQTLCFHSVSINRIFYIDRCISVKVSESTSNKGS